MTDERLGPAAIAGGSVLTAAALGGLVQRRASMRWYEQLRKPPGQPPPWVFGPVWSVLYLGIAWNGYRLWRGLDTGSRRRARALWAAQMGANAAWSPLFFGLRKPAWALADQVALDALTVALRRELSTADPRSARAIDAYLAWLAYATYLNVGVVVRNRPGARPAHLPRSTS